MKKSKKADWDAMKTVVVAIVVLVVLLPIGTVIWDLMGKGTDDETFRGKVLYAAESRGNVLSLKDPPEVPRDREFVTIYDDHYTVDGKKRGFELLSHEFEDEDVNKDVVSKLIANTMHSCWYKFFEGEKNPFERDYGVCYVCDIISVDDSAMSVGFETFIPNFDQYLEENSPARDERSYYEIFTPFTEYSAKSTGGTVKRTKNNILPNDVGTLDLVKPHAVVVMSTERYHYDDASGYKGRDDIWELFLMLRPLEDLGQSDCEYFYN